MIMNELLEQIKNSMRIRHTALDSQLLTDIDSGALELYRAGVLPYVLDEDGEIAVDDDGNREIREDALLRKAIEFYCKMVESYQDDAPRWTTAFEKLRNALSLSGDYRITENANE